MSPASPFAVVVNDDLTQLNVLCGLVRNAGLEPRAFTGAEAALADMSAGAGPADGKPGALPALVVTDLYMPGIDGWRFCRLLRSPEYAAFNQIPILVVSATFAGDEIDRIASELGADGFLPSPVDGTRFVERVSAILRGERLRTPLRVLIVEDSATLAATLQTAFAAHGYQAETALTAQAAADAFAHAAYNVAVLDYHLPDGRGDALLDVFRAARPDCVCLMMTTDPGPELALDWMKRGAAAYLRKPFQPDYLIELCAKARRERALLRVEDLLEVRTRELRESHELFSLFIRHSPIYAYIKAVTPTESRVLQASDNYQQMIGISGSDMVGKTMVDLFPADLAAKMTADDWAVVASGEVLKLDEDLNGRNYASIKFPIVQGDHTLLAGYTIDITERRRAEAALTHSHDLMRYIIEHNRSAVAVHDRDLKYVYVSQRYLQDYKVQERDVIGKHHYDVFPDLPQKWRDVHQKALAGEISSAEDDPYVRADGTVDWTRWECRPWYGADGSIGGIIIYTEVITERRQAQAEREKLQAQLNQAQKMESVGRLAGGVAHDFNNMLLAILGYAELALDRVDPAHPLHADLEEIRKAANRSGDLTRQLLAFARKQTVAPRVLDLNATILGMLKMLARIIGEDIDLAWRPGADLWAVRVDPSQIDQILANLCVNARDAIADVGMVAIETGNRAIGGDYCANHAGFVPGEYVQLSVSDNGCGMDKDTLAHIFEPFFTTKEMGKGTGLGLATVYGAVKQNSGFINACSEPGQGTTFTIYLPRHVGKAGQAPTDDAAGPAGRGHETVLVVEDESAILKLITVMLERQGYTVLAANTPGEAIGLAREYPGEIHLLMTDVVMPEMNGRDLARNLLSLYPFLARLFMSGYTEDVVAHHGVLEEGVHFIQKPFTIRDLAAKVREALGGE